MSIHLDPQTAADAPLITSRIGRMESDRSGDYPTDALFPENDDDDSDDSYIETDTPADEPTDDDGDPTGEHDHHQDDNYALGGHVTRSSS